MDWYLIRDGAASGAHNMAKDECLLRAAVRWNRPVLRLYDWERPTLSLGRNQRMAGALDPDACRRDNVPLVRRITGGWAVLHGDDLTYSISAPYSERRFGTTIHSTYLAIAEVFADLFGELGYAPTLHRMSSRAQAAQASPICFVTPSTAELLIDGRKIIGSAQRRGPDAFLQHGSIPLRDRSRLLSRLFRDTQHHDVAASMTDLDSIGLWSRTSAEGFCSRLIASFERVMDARFHDAPWGEAEDMETAALEAGYPPVDPDSLEWLATPSRAAPRQTSARDRS